MLITSMLQYVQAEQSSMCSFCEDNTGQLVLQKIQSTTILVFKTIQSTQNILDITRKSCYINFANIF